MIAEFKSTAEGIINLIKAWEPKLSKLSTDQISNSKNDQNRNIKQIVGHMVDSATNNTHRVIHLQYQDSPFYFPNYATHGNNDRWIAIQNYDNEDWDLLVQLWKSTNLHYVHVIKNIESTALDNEWITGENSNVSLKDMVIDYLRHLKLHLDQVDELI